MKKNFLILVAALGLSTPAFAYMPGGAGDPNQGFRDVETKTVVKVDSVTGYDDAITKGMALFYEDGAGSPAGLYKVSRIYSGTYNTALASKLQACVAARDVATGDLAGFPCVTGGYVDYAKYASVAAGGQIAIGDYLCVSDLSTSAGYLVPCASGVTSQFIALEAKTGTATGTMKIRVNGK